MAEYFSNDNRQFHTNAPRSRQERQNGQDKESYEKALLEKRPAQYGQKYINYGRHITAAPAGTVAYISEQDRFFTDFALEEKKRREERIDKEEDRIARKRYILACEEEDRWKRIDSEWKQSEEKELQRRQIGHKSNTSSVPYDPLTLEYAKTSNGEKLKYADDQIRYRAALRAENLRQQQSANGYNPVTGEAYPQPNLPSRPQKPSSISNMYH